VTYLIARKTPLLGALFGAFVSTPACTHRQHRHEGHHGHHGARFEQAAEWTGTFDDPARDGWQQPDDVVRALGLEPGMTVADLGAGTGYFEGRLSRAVGPHGAVFALDVEHDMVRFIDERAVKEGLSNVRALRVTGEDPGLAPGSVDVVLVVDVWHHLEGREAYAAKLARALKPGGRVMVVDFRLDATRGPPPGMRLSPEEVASELESAGLSTRLVPASLPEQYLVEGSKR
jgi:predicted methyltransferase